MKIECVIRKIERNEKIQRGDIHSLDGQVFYNIINEETIGQVPADFASDREFYRIVGPYVAIDNQFGEI